MKNKIVKLYYTKSLVNCGVAEFEDGTFKKFFVSSTKLEDKHLSVYFTRHKKELTPMPNYAAKLYLTPDNISENYKYERL